MFFINHSNIFSFLLFVFHIILSIFGPNISLHFINFLFLNFYDGFFIHLFVQKISHISFLLLDLLLSVFIVLHFSFILFHNMFHHFLVFFSDDLFLIFHNRVCKGGHNSFNFIFSVFLFQISLFFHFD